jgi:hypothetical protein
MVEAVGLIRSVLLLTLKGNLKIVPIGYPADGQTQKNGFSSKPPRKQKKTPEGVFLVWWRRWD